jgi:cytochrome c5
MYKIFLSFCVLALVSCSAKLLVPTQADADRGMTKYEGLSLTSLLEGKALFEQNCSKCHGLKSPTSRNEEKWNKIVPIMVKKVNKKAGKEELDAAEEQLILKYLVTMSTAPGK